MHEPKHISDYIGNVKSLIKDKYGKNQRINDIDWHSVAGDIISRHSHIDSLRNRKLHIACDSSVILFELNMQRDRILIELSHRYPHIVIDDLTLKVKPEE